MGRDTRGRDYGASEATHGETDALLHHAPDVGGEPFAPLELRKPQDRAWGWAFALLYAANLVAGVLTFLNRNPDFATQLSPDYLNDPAHCPADRPSHARSLFGLRAMDDDAGDAVELDQFLKHGLLWLLASVAGALILGLIFVLMVGRSPRLLLFLSLGVQVAIPLAAGGAALMQGATAAAVPMLVTAGVLALVLYLWREQLALVVQLMRVSGHGLRENLGLVGAAIGIQLGLAVLTLPLYLVILAALTNGHVTFNPARVDARAQPGQCVDAEGNDVLCCSWQPDAHVGPIVTVTLFTLLWTSLVSSQVKTFVVSGTIAQWYFAPVVADPSLKRGRVHRTLRAALGPSFGSLCFGGLVLTVLSLLRSALEELKKQADRNILLYCLYAMVQFLLETLQLVTKFATVRLAITGESFLQAGRNVTDMLRRNFLDAFGVWWFPPLILQMSALVLSLAWAAGTFFISAHAYSDMHQGPAFAAVLAVLSFLLSFVVLSFFISLLLNIIDTVFICFGMDRDRHTCSRMEVHQVYCQLPSVGPVIENPDHTYAYAAPTWGNQQQQQQQPYYHAPTAPGAYPTIPAQGTNPYAAPYAPPAGRV